MSNHSKIKSKPYRNWVRGALGLFYLQKGLYSFTDRVTKAEHAKIVQNLTPCTNCAIQDILPAHASGNVCLQTNKARCNCKKRKNRNCATCSKIYGEIVLQHRFRDPHWVTDCSTWYNDHWQFAKCFLTTTSKGSNNTAAETDASGLLSIIINGEFFQSEIQCNIDPPNDSFSKVREIRNEILHSSTLDIADHDLANYLQSMITVLEDKKTLTLDSAAQAAALKLKEILRDELIITTNEEACAIQTALNAIKVAKEQSEECIRKLSEEQQNTIKASEESVRKLAEESSNSLQQQTLESTTGITKAEKHAIEKLASTVATVFEKTYEPEIKGLKLRHEDHENRLKTIETEQQNLQTKQLKLENQVAELKATEEKHQTRIEYLKQKKGLQQYLVELYQTHHVKTSISPLMTRQNVVNIRDVYVSPRMVAEENKDDNEGNTSNAGNGMETNNRHIERYRDLFNRRNQKIFVIGDVGTGKSSFCKMMMQNWCSSITKRKKSDESDATDKDEVIQGEECNTCDMNQFDFLFYIPLCEMPKDIDNTVDMIKVMLGKYTTLVDDIFTNESERCLILADGLDEWTPKSNRQSLHHGIPTSRLAGDSTILTTSRPSSRGILDMKSSEYDLKVTLLGLKGSSVQPMIQKYMKLVNKTSAVTTFYNTLSNLSFKDIHNSPMLLQQIIWLYCNNYDISHSRSSIYLHIINAVLGWEHERTGHYPKLQSKSFEQLPLPKSFDKYPRCQENRELLLVLGKIAYDAYITGNDSSLVFGRYKLKQLGLSAEDIAAIVQTGILTEINCADPTYDKSRLTFIHTSYVEFFAALYICSCYLSKIADAHSSFTSLAILEGLIAVTPETSVAEILRLENVLIMICGLVPGLTEHVCECVYKLTPRGENMNDSSVEHKIQCLTFGCLSEHNSDDQQTVKFKLRHINLQYPFNSGCIFDIVPSSIETCRLGFLYSHEQCSLWSSFLSQAVSLRTLEIHLTNCTQDKCEGHTINFTNQRELQSIKLHRNNMISIALINPTCPVRCELSNCNLSHEQYASLCTFLSQAESLQYLFLDQIKCIEDRCAGHDIDLTNHKQLKRLSITNCNMISVAGINPTCPVRCELSNCNLSHEQYASLCTFLSQAESLQYLNLDQIKCIEDRCAGHDIDLTNHKQLKLLSITNCNMISVAGKNTTCPVRCELSNCNLSHEQYASLCTFLSQAESLQDLGLRNIKCMVDRCAGHGIDLTNHKQLQSIELSWSNISVSGINHTVLQSFLLCGCRFSHEQCTLLLSSLSQATLLEMLELHEVKCTKPECEGHCIDTSGQNHLRKIYISSCEKIFLSGVNRACLTSCCIAECELSHEQCSFLSSFLSQADTSVIELYDIRCIQDRCAGHVIDLTNHKQLRSLSITNCNIISVDGINPTCPVSCEISNCNLSHEQCVSLYTFLSQGESLHDLELDKIKCIEDGCAGHDIDLTNHKQLKNLSVRNCHMKSVEFINPQCPVRVELIHRNQSHEQFASICTYISQAEFLKDLKLDQFQCIEDGCAGHNIDLTINKQLERLSITNCKMTSVTGINPTCLESFEISNCNLSHEQYVSLCTFLSQAESLQDLNLDQIKCIENRCAGHDIDLTNHKQLNRLFITNCKMISVAGINPTCPVRCEISNCNLSHEQYASLCTFILQAESLYDLKLDKIKCIEDRCAGHDIDLTNHKQLWSLSIINCNMISVAGINPTCPVWCGISKCNLSHEQYVSFCTFLSQAESLYDLELDKIKCIEDRCAGHNIDLTNYKQLWSLSITNCNMISVAGINPTCPVRCEINNCNLSNKQYMSLCTFLSQAESLYDLKLDEIKCIEDRCAGHDIDLTNHKQLKRLSITKCNMMSITGINPTCPVRCEISNRNLSHEQHASLCTFLSQAESLHGLKLDEIKCIEDRCAGHDIDLTNHKQLKRLSITNCNMISVAGINPTCTVRCEISKCNLSNVQYASLCTFLSQAESLHGLKLDEIKCTNDRCPGHDIDLTINKQLKRLSLTKCNMISITGINPTCPVRCEISNCNISHEQYASLCTFLSQAESLHGLKLDEIKCFEDRCAGHDIDLTNHKQLKHLSITNCNMISVAGINPTCPVRCEISNCNLSHEQYSSLCAFLSQAESLHGLKLDEIKYIEDRCAGHYIDLMNHKQLKRLSIANCNMISVAGKNTTCPVRCELSKCNLSHEQYASLCTFLSQAESLHDLKLDHIKCIEDRCAGHNIDITINKQLKRLSLTNCNMTSVTGINPTCPESFENSNCNLSHEQYVSLCTFLSQAESLQYLNLDQIKCIENRCAGHDIDLTNHKQLNRLSVTNCNMISVAGMNPTCPV